MALEPADQAHLEVAIPPTDQFFELSKLRENIQRTPIKLKAGGKPSTWFPPGGLVELL